MKTPRLLALLAMLVIVGSLIALPFACVGMVVREAAPGLASAAEASTKVRMDLGNVAGKGLTVSGPINLEWQPGEAHRIEFEGPESLVERCRANVDSDGLKIYVEDGARWHSQVRARLTGPQPSALRMKGSGDVDMEDLAGDELTLDLSGSGDARLSGQLRKLTVSLQGSGEIDAEELNLQEASVSIAGSGDVELGELKRLASNIAGSGTIVHEGEPATESRITGSGEVRRR